ncbi:hypothetical protein ACQKAN_06375 [Helicobacter pylori]
MNDVQAVHEWYLNKAFFLSLWRNASVFLQIQSERFSYGIIAVIF